MKPAKRRRQPTLVVGTTRFRVNTKHNLLTGNPTPFFGHVGTLDKVQGSYLTLEFTTLRDGNKTEEFRREDVQLVKALKAG